MTLATPAQMRVACSSARRQAPESAHGTSANRHLMRDGRYYGAVCPSGGVQQSNRQRSLLEQCPAGHPDETEEPEDPPGTRMSEPSRTQLFPCGGYRQALYLA